jgi:HrpA-like RNA helicase
MAITDKTLLLAVHSDIPHEQQLLAFQPTAPDEIKIVIATNAAESSVTIPDVDHVICLGASKVLTYNARQHTTQLVNSWCVLFLLC